MEGLIKEKTLAKKTGVNRMLLVRERKKSLNYPDGKKMVVKLFILKQV